MFPLENNLNNVFTTVVRLYGSINQTPFGHGNIFRRETSMPRTHDEHDPLTKNCLSAFTEM